MELLTDFMKGHLRAFVRRLWWALFGKRVTYSRQGFKAHEKNLRAEGFLIVRCRCGRCGHEERCAIYPENVGKLSECGGCWHKRAEVVEVEGD